MLKEASLNIKNLNVWNVQNFLARRRKIFAKLLNVIKNAGKLVESRTRAEIILLHEKEMQSVRIIYLHNSGDLCEGVRFSHAELFIKFPSPLKFHGITWIS